MSLPLVKSQRAFQLILKNGIVRKTVINGTLLSLGLAFSLNALAHAPSRSEYRSGKKKIVAEHRSDRKNCRSLADNTRNICMAEANGKEVIARSELKALHKPSKHSDYDVNITRADAFYAVAIGKCDDHTGSIKEVCVIEAKATKVRAKYEARIILNTAQAKPSANMNSLLKHI